MCSRRKCKSPWNKQRIIRMNANFTVSKPVCIFDYYMNSPTLIFVSFMGEEKY